MARKHLNVSRGNRKAEDCDDPCGCDVDDQKKPDKNNQSLSDIRSQLRRVSRETSETKQELRRVRKDIDDLQTGVRRNAETNRQITAQVKRTASEVLRVRADVRKISSRVESLEIRHGWYNKAFTRIENDIRSLRMEIAKLKSAPAPMMTESKVSMWDQLANAPGNSGNSGPGVAAGVGAGLGAAALFNKFKHIGRLTGRGIMRFVPGMGVAAVGYGAYRGLDEIGKANEARDKAAGITQQDIDAERGAGTFDKTEITRKRQDYHRKRKNSAYDDLKAETARLKAQAAQENGFKHRQRYNRWNRKTGAVDVNDGRHMLASGSFQNMQVPHDFLRSGPSFRDQYERSQIEDQKTQFQNFGKLPTGFEFLEGHMGRLGTAGALRAAGIQHATGPESMRTFPGAVRHSGSYTMPSGGQYSAPGSPGYGSGNLNSGPTAPFQPMTGSTSIPSSGYGTNAQQAIEKIAAERGWTKAGVAALLANIKQESSFNPYTIGDGGKSFGLFQMNGFGGGRGPTRIGALEQVMKEKTGLQDPLQYIRDVQAGRIKPDPKITEGMIAAQVEHFVYRDVDKSINNDNVQRGLQSNDLAQANKSILSAIRPDNWNKQREAGWEWSKRLGNAQSIYQNLDLDKWKSFQGAPTGTNAPSGAPLSDDRIPNKTRLPGGDDATRLRQDFGGSILHKTPLTLEQLKEGKDPRSKAYGYHTAIDQDGNIHELRGYDVRSNHITSVDSPDGTRTGAKHLNNYNAYGVALTGSGQMNDKVKEALIKHYSSLVARGILPRDYGEGTLPTYGHGEIQKDGGRAFLDRGRTPEGSEAAKFINENWKKIVEGAGSASEKSALLLPGATRYGNQRDDRGILDRENAEKYYRGQGNKVEMHDRTGKETILERIMKSKGQLTISAFSDGAKDLAKVWDQIPDEKKKLITIDMVGANDVAKAEQFKGAANIRVNPEHDGAYQKMVRQSEAQGQPMTSGISYNQRMVDSITGANPGATISDKNFGTEGPFRVTEEQNRNRPDVLRGRLSVQGTKEFPDKMEFDVISGGSGKQSLPLGVHNLSYQRYGSTIAAYSAHINDPSKVHSWNVGSNELGPTGLRDPKRGNRSEIQIHIGGIEDLNRLRSQGCLVMAPSKWKPFTERMLALMKEKGGKLLLRVGAPGKDGISQMSIVDPNSPEASAFPTMTVPEFVKNMGVMTSTDERQNMPYGHLPKFNFAENTGLAEFNQNRPELLQSVQKAAQDVPGITLNKPLAPQQPTGDGSEHTPSPVAAPPPGPQAVPDWGKNWAAEATPKSDVPPMTTGPFAPPPGVAPGTPTQPLTMNPAEPLTGPKTQTEARRDNEMVRNPGRNGFERNHPESQQESPGSSGMGSYGRCFI